MQIGDVVVPNANCKKLFVCGSGYYTHAIVGSINPFILVSSAGDMVWSCTWKEHEVTSLCQASKGIQSIVQKRLTSYLNKE